MTKHALIKRGRIFISICFVCLFLGGVTELLLRHVFGLGDPLLVEYNAAYAYRLLPSQKTERFINVPVTIDERGFRSSMTTHNADDRVLILGSDLVFGGMRVADGDLFISIMNSLFDGEYVNGGVPGWSIFNMSQYINSLDSIDVDKVVFILQDDDFYRSFNTGHDQWFSLPRSAFAHVFGIGKGPFSKKNSETKSSFLSKKDSRVSAVQELKHIYHILSLSDIDMVLLLSPDQDNIAQLKGDTDIRAELQRARLPYVDLWDDEEFRTSIEVLGPERSVVLFDDHHHLSRDGHRLWALYVSRVLKR